MNKITISHIPLNADLGTRVRLAYKTAWAIYRNKPLQYRSDVDTRNFVTDVDMLEDLEFNTKWVHFDSFDKVVFRQTPPQQNEYEYRVKDEYRFRTVPRK